LIRYLQKKGIYDETFIIFVNDHGMGAKGTLFEQGSRTMQFVRFPPLFGTNGYVLDDFITSNVDLAAVIFELSGITVDDEYGLDGQSWIGDVYERVNGINKEPACCEHRFIDMYNSHAIVNQEWKYIWRATNEMEPDGNPAALYPYSTDENQLYNLDWDPNEQSNLIGDESLSEIVYAMQVLMIEYIENEVCASINISCKVPELLYTLSPTSAPTGPGGDELNEKQLSGGAIAAIVIVVLLVVICGVLGGGYVYAKKTGKSDLFESWKHKLSTTQQVRPPMDDREVELGDNTKPALQTAGVSAASYVSTDGGDDHHDLDI